MAIPILKNWPTYFTQIDEGLGSSYERIVLNNKLLELCQKYQVKNLLESPSFGFTGISGINSFAAAQNGIATYLTDHDQARIELIADFWSKYDNKCQINFVANYADLPFADQQFELSWNFSALWFTQDLSEALAQMSRCTSKAIFICVPNRSGLGYLSQKLLGRKELAQQLNEANIIPQNIVSCLQDLDWNLVEQDFIDCPWWPDIGMPKAKFFRIFGLGWLFPQKSQPAISIMDYYSGHDPNFPDKMLKHYWFEKIMPAFIKKFWAHHRYFLFEPTNNQRS